MYSLKIVRDQGLAANSRLSLTLSQALNGCIRVSRRKMQGRCGAQQQHATCITALPEHVIDIVSSNFHSSSGSLTNFMRSCKAFRAAGHRSVATLDLYELCGWGDGSSNAPLQALLTTQLYPNIRALVFPSGWRSQNIRQLLQHAADSSRTWKQLSSISMHFHALSPSAGSALAAYAPNLTQLILSLDLAFEQTRSQARRIIALQQLRNLASLIVEPDLRTEALQRLAELPRLQQLQLVGPKQGNHPEASLQALVALKHIMSLTFHWQAGRSLSDGYLLAHMTNLQELRIWISGGSQLPPCSSKPLPGMVQALGQLTGLTRLELLQGLYMSWDLREIRHLSGLHKLQVLGLHDSVLCDDDLALLAPCTSLHHLRVDAIKLPAIRSAVAHAPHPPPAAAAAAAGAVGGTAQNGLVAAVAAIGDIANTAGATTPAALALKTLSRLQRLEVNMLQLGLWHLDEVCPKLTQLSPLECTLGAKGHGVVWELGAIEGHANLQILGLMVGALGTTCSCSKSYKTANCAESLAAAVVRVIMQSAGVGRLSSTPSGCTGQQLLALLQSLPRLQILQLWGHAGGVSGKLHAALKVSGRTHSTNSSSSSMSILAGSRSSSAASSRCSSPCQSPYSSSSSGTAAASTPECASSPRSSSVASVVSDLLSSFGALLSPRSRAPSSTAAAAAADSLSCHGSSVSQHEGACVFEDPCLVIPISATCREGAHHPQQEQQYMHGRLCAAVPDRECSTGSGSTGEKGCADTDFVLQLLHGLPQLKIMQLNKCTHLAQAGWDVAVQNCCKSQGAAVVVLR